MATLFACVALVTSCSTIEAPKVTLTGVEFEGISKDGMEFTLLVDVTNLNDFGAEVSKLDYSILIDESEIAKGVRTEDVVVRAGATVEVAVPFTLTWVGAREGLKEFLDGQEHEWKLKGSANVRKGGASKTFSFVETGDFRGPSTKDVRIDF